MTQEWKHLEQKLLTLWMKLLKASVKGKSKKIAKIESKLIQLELEKKDGKTGV